MFLILCGGTAAKLLQVFHFTPNELKYSYLFSSENSVILRKDFLCGIREIRHAYLVGQTECHFLSVPSPEAEDSRKMLSQFQRGHIMSPGQPAHCIMDSTGE